MGVNTGLKHSLCVLILGAASVVPARATFTFIVDAGAGNGTERCVSSQAAGPGGNCAAVGAYSGLESMIQLFADAEGNLTITRVDDSADEIWTAGAGAGVFGIARSASRDFTLGMLPGESGGGYTEDLNVIGTAGSVEYLPAADVPASGTGQNLNGDIQASATYAANGMPTFTSISSGTFRFAIQCVNPTGCGTPAQTWSSLPTDNSDGLDHMVTWELTGGAVPVGDVWYIAGFENGTDGDFNDYLFLFQNVTPSGIAPEPASLILFLTGLFALFTLRRSSNTPGPRQNR
jgi:hypothetical protein